MSDARITGEAPVGLRLEGTLRAADAVALLTHLPLGDQRLRVDLSGIEAVDSAGLALLLDWQDRLQQQGGGLELLAPPAALIRLARISGVDTLLNMETNDAEMTRE